MNKCVLEDSHDWTSARMTDPDSSGCFFYEDENDADFVVLGNDLGFCGMSLSFANDTIIYSNTLTVQSKKIDDMIITKPNLQWEFTCSYDTEYEIDGNLTINAASISQGFTQTNAQFDFSFDFYTDGNFDEIQDAASYQVGQFVNFGVTMNGGTPLSSLNFVASSCQVTNGDNTYTIFDMNNPDHCERAPPVFFEQQTSDNPAQSFYSYMGFSFMDETEESSSQRVSCTINVCHEDDADSVCYSGCYSNSTVTAP